MTADRNNRTKRRRREDCFLGMTKGRDVFFLILSIKPLAVHDPLTFPGEQSGQELAQADPSICVLLGWVVVGELP